MRRHETNVDMNINSYITVNPSLERENICFPLFVCLLNLQSRINHSSADTLINSTHTIVIGFPLTDLASYDVHPQTGRPVYTDKAPHASGN